MGRMISSMICLLSPREIVTVPIVLKAGWRTRIHCCEEGKISLPHRGSEPQTIHSVSRAKHEYLRESRRLYCSCPSSLQFPPTGLPAVRTQQPNPGTWETPVSASLQTAWLQQINKSAAFKKHSWSMSGNYPPPPSPVTPRFKTKHCPLSWASWNQTTHYFVESPFNITFPSMSVSPKWFFLQVSDLPICSEIGCLKAWVSKFLWQRGTPVIVGCFAGRTWKKHRWYT
jgi:hypothetical protein